MRAQMREPQRVEKFRQNVAYARAGIKQMGFDVLASPTAILPIIVHDTAKAIVELGGIKGPPIPAAPGGGRRGDRNQDDPQDDRN